MLYIFDEIYALDDTFPERCLPYLSEQRREKAFAYRFPLDRKLSVAAYLLLRLALKENNGIDEPVVFSYGENGKPFLRDYPQIHFNMSHCRSAVACIISDCEAGVDVQEIIPVSDDLAGRVLTAKEYAEYKASACPYELFCEYWTVKESYLKRTGLGIGIDLTVLSAEDTGKKMLFRSGKDYCCCATGDPSGLRHVHVHELI